MNEVRKNNTQWMLWLGLALCTLYQSYRYPLQINSSLTSPTYSDTPFILQAGKFILALPLFVGAATQCFRKPLSLQQWLVVLAVLFLSLFALLKAFATGGPEYLEAAFWMPFSLVLVWASDAISIKALDRFFQIVLIYALGTNLIEVLLFLFFGRLPALAYENSFSVRFGGFLDDPNGFAALLFLLMGWSYGRLKGRTRKFVLSCIGVSLLITQSGTALIVSVAMFVFWAVKSVSKQPLRVMMILCGGAGLTGLVCYSIPDSAISVMQALLESKQGSAEGHMFPWAELAPRWAEWIMHGNPEYFHYESWWAGALVNFGAPWLCVDFVLIVACTFSLKAALARASEEARPVYLGFCLFGFYFLLGSLNLALPQGFPINVFFFVFSFLVVFRKIQPENSNMDQRSAA